jgi:hypothetical protein
MVIPWQNKKPKKLGFAIYVLVLRVFLFFAPTKANGKTPQKEACRRKMRR